MDYELYHEVSNGLFAVMAGLVVFKILFRKALIVFLSSSLDMLVISITLAMAIVAPQFDGIGDLLMFTQLPLVMMKSVV